MSNNIYFWWEPVKFHVSDLLCLKCSDDSYNNIWCENNSPYCIIIVPDNTNLNRISGKNNHTIVISKIPKVIQLFVGQSILTFETQIECMSAVEELLKNNNFKIIKNEMEVFI